MTSGKGAGTVEDRLDVARQADCRRRRWFARRFPSSTTTPPAACASYEGARDRDERDPGHAERPHPLSIKLGSLPDRPVRGQIAHAGAEIKDMGEWSFRGVEARLEPGSVTRLERGLQCREVIQLIRQPLETVEDTVHLTLRPFQLLRTHLGEGAAQLIIDGDEAIDTREPGFRDAPVDLAGEIDDLIRLAHHLFHPSPPPSWIASGPATHNTRQASGW